MDCKVCDGNGLVLRNRGGQWFTEKCPACTCPKCEGAGEYEEPTAQWAGPDAERYPCSDCLTTGRVAGRKW